jgi:hypothetical protein
MVQFMGLGALLVRGGRAVQQFGLLGYQFGYFRKKKLAMGSASVTGMLRMCSIQASSSIFSSL